MLIQIDMDTTQRSHRTSGFLARRCVRGAMWVALTVGLILSGASVALEKNRPPFYASGLTEKYLCYEKAASRPDILFVGSSRVYRGVWPHFVELGMSQAGGPDLRVFNFGIGGMTAPMLGKIIDFLDEEAAGQQLVLLEPDLVFGAAFKPDVSDRSRFCNQYSTLPLALLQIATQEGNTWSKLERFLSYAVSFSKTGVGTSTLRFSFLKRDPGPKLDTLDLPEDGFISIEDELDSATMERRNQLEQRRFGEKYRQLQRKRQIWMRRIHKQLTKPPRPITAAERLYIKLLLERRNSGDLRYGLVFTPTTRPWKLERQRAISEYMREHHPSVPLLAVDPGQMPELYDPEFWFDTGHLNAEGAQCFSRELGRQLSSWFSNSTGV